jgi:phosphoribosylanthranilate isomerase
MSRDVKVCGVTSAGDARLCHAAGAGLLGVILTASPRQIDPLQAAAIVAAVPGVRVVGVVRDAPTAALALQLRVAGVHAVQMHGPADPRRWAAVSEASGLPIMPAVTADQADAAFAAARDLPGLPLAGLLLDLPKGAAADQTARDRLWAAARRGLAAGLPVRLAGSLTAADLPRVRRAVGACDLDVCRGTERAPGVKDPDLVRGFLAAARDPEVRRVS